MTHIVPPPTARSAAAAGDVPGARPPGSGARRRPGDLVRRAPLITFLVLSCLLSWWPAALYAVDLSPAPMAGFGPFLAAIIVLATTQGRAGVGRLLRSMVHWRVPVGSYLAAVGLPVLVSMTAVVVNLALGAARPTDAGLALWTNVPVVLLLVLLVPGLGGAWEEPGFRGYALARLERRFGRLAGPLLLGGFWVLWHAPLFAVGQIPWTDVLTIVAASVVIAAVYHSARDSVLVAMLLHSTNNAIGGEYASQLFEGSDAARLGLLTAAGWWLVAGAILLRGNRTRPREARQQRR